MNTSYFERDLANNELISDADLDKIHDIKNVVWEEHHNRSTARALCYFTSTFCVGLTDSVLEALRLTIGYLEIPDVPTNEEIAKLQDTYYKEISKLFPMAYDINHPDVFQLTVNQVGEYKFLEKDWVIYCQEPILAELMPHIDVHKCTIREDGSLAFNYLKFNNGEEFTFERHAYPYLNGLSISETSIGIAYQLFQQVFELTAA